MPGLLVGIDRLAHRTGLIDLDEHRIAGVLPCSFGDQIGIGDEIVVANDLNPVAEATGEFLHSPIVVFAERVLDRGDRISLQPTTQQVDQATAVQFAVVEGQPVTSALSELGCGDVERDDNPVSRLFAGLFDSRDERFQRLLVAVEDRPPAAFVGDTGRLAFRGHDVARGEIDLAGDFHDLVEGPGARHHDHEVLDVDAASGVGTAAKDLNLRQRQRRRVSVVVGDVAPQRLTRIRGSGMQDGK